MEPRDYMYFKENYWKLFSFDFKMKYFCYIRMKEKLSWIINIVILVLFIFNVMLDKALFNANSAIFIY